MPQFQSFNPDDQIVETTKVTKGYFSGDVGSLTGTNLRIISGTTLGTGNDEYYFNVQKKGTTADQFSVAFGQYDGSGSNVAAADAVPQTQAIYKQMSNLLLFPDDMESNGFKFDGSTTEKNVYFIIGERARMKERFNKKNWTLFLSSSKTTSLTDDSDTVAATATPVGPRYNIKSGSAGTLDAAASSTIVGWVYPNIGVMAFSGTRLSHSVNSASNAGPKSSSCVPDLTSSVPQNARDFARAIAYKDSTATAFTLRSEEDQIVTSYFVRARARDWNFSNNPTFGSGSDYTFTIKDFTGNPQTFITSIGLYDGGNNLVAVGRLSTPVKKNFSTEMVAKVNLVH